MSPACHTRAVRRLTVPLLVWTMSSGTMAYAALSVMATAILADLGIGATELGLVLLTYSAGAAVLSPIAGPITDRIGGAWAARLTLLVAAMGYPLMGLATSTLWLAVAVLPVAFAQALINPATNAVIAAHAAVGRRGVVTGIKQSGVYVGFTFVGLVAPAVSAAAGWQATFWVLGVVCLVGFVLSFPGFPPTPGTPRGESKGVPITARGALVRLTVFAALMGFASSINNFIPLFAESELGYSNTVAGLITATIGGIAVVTRIVSAGWAERSGHPGRFLRFMAAMGIGTNVALALAATVPALVWLAAGTYAFGLAPWNAVAMLAIIVVVGPASAGTATGWVVGAFSAGLALGPLTYGPVIDQVGFGTVWLLSGAAAALAAVSMVGFRAEPAEVA